MDFQRVILVVALTFTLFLMWKAWEQDYGVKPAATPVATTAAPAPSPSQRDVPSATGIPAPAAPAATPGQPALESAQRVHFETDVLRGQIDTLGGDLREVALPKYPVSVSEKNTPVEVLKDKGQIFVAQTGLVSQDAARPGPDHYAVFTAEQQNYRLAPGQDTLQVRLNWSSEKDGLQVEKTYTFHRGSYVIGVDYRVHNTGTGEWRGSEYRQWLRSEPPKPSRFFANTYAGGVLHGTGVNYEKVSFKDMHKANLAKETKGGWAAMVEHYFLGAWIPPQDGSYRFYSKDLGENRYTFGMIGPEVTVGPGQTTTLPTRLYVGPKDQDVLGKVAPGLELTVDYGWLTFIAKPLWWSLEFLHKILGNWGWAIIILTVLIKAAFYKLSETSYKSMAHMRKVQPRLVALKERFGDDRQKLNEAMMKLYREEKINPLGGCLPIVVQIPVFIALYWVLLGTVELRQAPWIFWIRDLSVADPYYVLPFIMGVSMLIQQRLNPSPMDPIQAKVMMILPVVFTVFFVWFPAGLVLYWVVNNTLSILQQWYITRWVVKS